MLLLSCNKRVVPIFFSALSAISVIVDLTIPRYVAYFSKEPSSSSLLQVLCCVWLFAFFFYRMEAPDRYIGTTGRYLDADTNTTVMPKPLVTLPGHNTRR